MAFAVFATPAHRQTGARAMAAFEMAFDYVDCLSEMPNEDPILNGSQLSRALSVAVSPKEPHADYYAHHTCGENDGGYLQALVQTCKNAIAGLPAYHIVSEPLARAATRIAKYQTYNHGDAHGSHEPFKRWAQMEHASSRAADDLFWWEHAAAYGSSLLVFALIAAASSTEVQPTDVRKIEREYLPWIGAANSLLDSFVDQGEDAEPGQHRLLDYYTTDAQAGERLQYIVGEAARHAYGLAPRYGHTLLVAAMVSFYLSAPELKTSTTATLRRAIRRRGGGLVRPTMWVLRARRAVGRLWGAVKAAGYFNCNSSIIILA